MPGDTRVVELEKMVEVPEDTRGKVSLILENQLGDPCFHQDGGAGLGVTRGDDRAISLRQDPTHHPSLAHPSAIKLSASLGARCPLPISAPAQ